MEQNGHLVYTNECGKGWGQVKDMNGLLCLSKDLNLIFQAFGALNALK